MATETAPSGVRDRPIPVALAERLTSPVAGGGQTVTTTAPFTGEPLAELPLSTAADVATAFERARAAQADWARRSARERAAPFLRMHDLVLANTADVLDILQWETGKARRHAFEEVYDIAAGTLHTARTAPKLLKRSRRAGAIPMLTRTYVRHQPKGVVAVITPWNYPLALPVSDIVPALIAGNAVVSKPDTQTALSTLWARDLAVRAGLPGELWQVVLGDPEEVGPALVENADYVAFTGSSRAGAQIAQQAAARLVGCSLELGGKNPMIVRADADVERTGEGAVRACFTNAGQLCISMERLYVHNDVYDTFVPHFVERVRAMRLSTTLDFEADMGSLTFPRQLETVTRHVQEAVEAGATVLTGGRPRPDLGPLFYEPTVLTDVTRDMRVCTDETFGPVVSIYRYYDDDEAVRAANDTRYGLNASVWTKDVREGRRLAERIQAGTVNVNEGYGAAYASYAAPMGGFKGSGLGRRHGSEGVLRYTEPQTVASQHLMGLGGPPGMSFATFARVMTLTQGLMKRLRLK
ncbi:MAG: aldehyde dehydrogenase family protein [Streptosporangiales bacterium]|nr:aldehyde dehydrogenase family protein [Streptosporangiales bacterium]